LYLQAAETGDAQAQYNLADLYVHGEGVSQDDAKAFASFQKAAAHGHAGARIMLGSMYAAGRGTAKDLPAAYLWISAAALQGDPRGNALLLSGAATYSCSTCASQPELAIARECVRTLARRGLAALRKKEQGCERLPILPSRGPTAPNLLF